MTDRFSLSFFLLLLFLAPGGVFAEDPPVEAEEEAPVALFDQKIGDVGVVLDADGTWTTRLSGGWGQGFTSEGTLSGMTYPGFEQSWNFTQEPDFSLTLRLLERYYLEVAYRGSLEDRSFLAGYDGKKGEVVQWAKVGNASFGIPSRAGQSLADGRRGAPAAAAAFELGPVNLEFLGRYEDGTRETKTYQGFREANASTVALDAWVRQRFFRLPGATPFSGVRILVADPSGSLVGTTGAYRDATSAEAVADLSTGEIRLAATATKRFLVTWSGATTAYTSPILSLTPGSEDIAGVGTFLVLVQPGSPTPFELRNRYAVATGTTGSILLVDADDGSTVSGHDVTHASTQDWFEVGGSEEAPFYYEKNGTLKGLYPASSPPVATAVLPWVFRLPTSTTATSYQLGTDIEASSLVVTRNGVATTAYSFDTGSGALSFNTPVYETDAVVISFQRKSTANKASDLVLWHGGQWTMDQGQTLEWNLQSRWNMEQGKYTTEDLQSPGKLSASVAWAGSAGDWTWKLSATGGALLADSTGHRRIAGWSSSGTQATYDGDSLRPATPQGILIVGSDTWNLTDTNRAPTYFRDYWTTDSLTGSPQVSAWGKTGVNRQDLTSGGWMGPYLVRGDGSRTDRLGVVEADLAPGTWAGMEVFVDSGKPLDLKAASAISATLRLVGGTGSEKVYLQAGTVAEDFDGTGTVRSVEYRTHPALAFSDNGTRRYFPIPEGSTWGNDGQSDGTAGDDGTLVTIDLSSSLLTPSDTGWVTVRTVLTDTERQLLQSTTGWRLVVVSPATATATAVTLMAGPVVFEGTTWSVVADGLDGAVSAAELSDASRTDGHLLRVDWSSATTRTSWNVEGRVSAVRPSAYRSLSFEYKVPDTTLNTLTLNLTNASGKGAHVTWTPSHSSTWATAKVDLREKTLTVDGSPVAATVTVDKTTGSWDKVTLGAGVTAGGSGAAYFTEIEAVDPVWEAVGTSVAKATWKQTAAWPSADLPLVTGLNLGLTSTQSGLSEDDAEWIGQTTLAGTLGIVRASGEASYTRSATTAEAHGAYEATLPLVWPGGGPSLELTDKFSDQGLRSERLRLGLPWVGTWEAYAKVEGVPTTLDQTYRASWTSPSWLPAGWNAGLWAQWDQTQATDLTLSGFGSQWVESWSWLVPTPTLATYHLVQSQGTFQAGGGPWSLAGTAVAKAAQTIGTTTSKWTPGGSWTLKAPLRFQTGGVWSLTPSVSKKVESVFNRTQAVDPGTSASEGASWLAAQSGGLLSAPFAEQAGTPWADSGVQTGTVESAAALDWDRESSSDWRDLVIPGSGGVKVSAIRGQESSADYRTGTVSAYLQARGLNLFGTLGAQPVFTWYRTDGWTWSVSAARSVGTRTTDESAEAALGLRSDLVISTQEKFALPVTYAGKWSTSPTQTLGFKPTWTLEHRTDLPFEIPRWLSSKSYKRKWIQEISGVLDVGWQPVTLPTVRNLQVSWVGRYLLSDKSELKFTTQWGQQWQQTLMVLGLQAAVDLILSF